MEIPIKMDDLWVPPFKETPIFTVAHLTWLNHFFFVSCFFSWFFSFPQLSTPQDQAVVESHLRAAELGGDSGRIFIVKKNRVQQGDKTRC